MNRSLFLALLAALGLVLAGCTADSTDPASQASQDLALPAADTSQWLLPLQLEGHEVFETGWVTEPQVLDGIFLAPREADGALEFTAVNPEGQILWSARRPISCTGFVLTRTSSGQPLAVLSDLSTTDTALAATTATAYDLQTGEQVWGPVQVPGPHQGPGLVYSAPPEAVMGETGPKTVLDPDTGQVLIDESTDPHQRVIGDYHGLTLVATDEELRAVRGPQAQLAWQLDASELGADPAELRPVVGQPREDVPVQLQRAHEDHLLLNLDDGRVLADSVREALTDAVSGYNVVLRQQQLEGLDPDGQPQWQLSVPEGTTLAGPGDALVFTQNDGTLAVHNAVTGALAQGYGTGEGRQIILPVLLDASGAAVVTDHSHYYLAAAPRAES